MEGRNGLWELTGADVPRRRWPTLGEALDDLWRGRSVRDLEPWAVGWLGYQACARLAGDLTARQDAGDVLAGLLLLEPERTSCSTVLTPGRAHRDARLRTSLSDESYRNGIETIKASIADGSVYQVNLCRRFSVDGWEGGLQTLFEAADHDRSGPEYLSAFSWDGVFPGELVCASMELLVSSRQGCLETGPIKGTRRRGVTLEEDMRLMHQLESDPKEKAELAMIVDLERNDLGRVARTGSVVVEEAGRVRSWERVHHRVAKVTASVGEGVSWIDVVTAMAPGGSVTGCPKRAAMSVISDLEPVSRGPFTGALGVIAGNGDIELALPIRTAWTSPGQLEMAAGCGIVWESDPAAEEAESRLKIGKWLELVGVSG